MYIATILVSFLLTVAAIPAFIRFYHRAHISGQQMHEDVKQHKAKARHSDNGVELYFSLQPFLV